MIIDAKDAVVGRVAVYAAKQALLGQEILVINAEKAVISGAKRALIEDAKRRKSMGVPRKGPFFSKLPDRYVRRIIRGMLPTDTPRGRAAFARVKCHIGAPSDAKDVVRAPGADASKLPNLKRLTIGRICEELGGKHYD